MGIFSETVVTRLIFILGIINPGNWCARTFNLPVHPWLKNYQNNRQSDEISSVPAFLQVSLKGGSDENKDSLLQQLRS